MEIYHGDTEFAEIFYFKLFLCVLSASAVKYSEICTNGANLYA